MITLAKHRRTWFALLRELHISPEDRHDVQEAHTGKRHLADWTAQDFDRAIAALQRAAGQHRDGHAHIRADAVEGRAPARPAVAVDDPPDRSDPSDAAVACVAPAPPPVDVPRGDGWATRDQARFIEDLCERIHWRTGRQLGAKHYAAHTILRGPANALRRHHLSYDGEAPRARRESAWLALTRAEASDFIKALKKLGTVNPRQEASHADRP